MDKEKVLIVLLIILIGNLAFAYDIPNLDSIANPWTGEEDYFVDVNDLGANFNNSGFNTTADVCFCNQMGIGTRTPASKLVVVGDVNVTGGDIITTTIKSSNNTAGMKFTEDGGMEFWLYDP